MDLHARIMSIPFGKPDPDWTPTERLIYKLGHREARHAAAELANEADARIETLERALKDLADEFVKVFPIYYYAEPWAHDKNVALKAAREAMKEKP